MKCTARNRRGIRCGADAMKDARHCFMHSPRTAAARREAQRLGGRNRMMLALRPAEVLAPGAEPTALAVPAPASPPTWWNLTGKPDVLEALRDVARATLARKLDPRSANTTILALQTILAEQRAQETYKRADRRAKREWARSQLRDRLEALKADLRTATSKSDLLRIENHVEYIERLVRRAHITPGVTSLAVFGPPHPGEL